MKMIQEQEEKDAKKNDDIEANKGQEPLEDDETKTMKIKELNQQHVEKKDQREKAPKTNFLADKKARKMAKKAAQQKRKLEKEQLKKAKEEEKNARKLRWK